MLQFSFWVLEAPLTHIWKENISHCPKYVVQTDLSHSRNRNEFYLHVNHVNEFENKTIMLHSWLNRYFRLFMVISNSYWILLLSKKLKIELGPLFFMLLWLVSKLILLVWSMWKYSSFQFWKYMPFQFKEDFSEVQILCSVANIDKIRA